MALIPLNIQPGLFKNGTNLEAAGRWKDSNLVRWHDSILKPVGGWRNRLGRAFDDPIRGLIAWKSNTGTRYIACGTYQHLFVVLANNITLDITPSGLVTGRADAAGMTGYGSGFYSNSTYGTPPINTSSILQDATSWSFSTFGEKLIANNPDDGKVYEWNLNSTNVASIVHASAPTSVKSIIVSNERFLFAFQTRTVYWSDQEDITSWSSSATNQAGNIGLETQGTIKCAEIIRGGILILTDQDAHTATYIGLPFVHSIKKVGSSCGIFSAQAAIELDMGVVWMGQSGFHIFSGGRVQELKCDVSDHVFSELNFSQASKIAAVKNTKYDEVIWYYPTSDSNENNRYVSWNYANNTWSIGSISRTCGIDAGIFQLPIHATGKNFDNNHARGRMSVKALVDSNVDPDVADVGNYIIQYHTILGYGTGTTFASYKAFFTGNNNLDLLNAASVGHSYMGYLAVETSSSNVYNSVEFPAQTLRYRYDSVHSVGSGLLYTVSIGGLDADGNNVSEVIQISGDGGSSNTVYTAETANTYTKLLTCTVVRNLNSYSGISFGIALASYFVPPQVSWAEIKASYLGVRNPAGGGGTNPSVTNNKIIDVELAASPPNPPQPGFITGGYVKFSTASSETNHNAGNSASQQLGTYNKALLVKSEYMLLEHEVGEERDSQVPYAETGTLQMGNGEQIMHVNKIIPDEQTQGQVNAEFKTRFYPNGAETSHGAYSLSNPTSVRFQGREVRMKINNVSGDWRVGQFRINAIPGGRR